MNDKDSMKIMKLKERIRNKENTIRRLQRKINNLQEDLDLACLAADHWIAQYEDVCTKEKALRATMYEFLKADELSESFTDPDLPF